MIFQMIKKKKLSIYVYYFSILTCSFLMASQSAENNTGKDRILSIMRNTETGDASYINKTAIAETNNLSRDLNIEEIAAFFDCKTFCGHSYLVEMLKSPLNKNQINSLVTRQEAIKILVDNPSLLAQVRELTANATANEKEVIDLMSDLFIGRTCPKLAFFEECKKDNLFLYKCFHFLELNPTARNVIHFMDLSKIIFHFYNYILRNVNKSYKNGNLNELIDKKFFFHFVVSASYIFSLRKELSDTHEKRQKLYSLNQLINAAEKLELLCAENLIKPQFKLSEIESLEGKDLIVGLKHTRYQRKDEMFFLTPNVEAFLYQVYCHDKHLAKLFSSIAELDVYSALATKIVESQASSNKLCFSKFLNEENPRIDASCFWNLIVPNAVTNSVSLDNNVILTGPNAGGKSTTIKSILQNIILAQSFGIAAGEKFDFTPFDVIHSYLNVSDDLVNGLSLFASEVKRAQEILQTIKKLDDNQKFFFALDELFTGTSSEDGEICACEFVQRLGDFKKNLFIYATHFNKLKELASNSKFFTNFKIDAPIKKSDGKLVYPFTLSPGASDSRVALDIAREANLFS